MNTKTAYPYEDPHYGQYGRERRESSDPLNTMLLLGSTAAAGGLLHHGLMSSDGRLAQAYQNNMGRAVRGLANKGRAGLGMPEVAQPPPAWMQNASKVVRAVRDHAEPLLAGGKGLVGAAGAATAAGMAHTGLMGENTNRGEIYRRVLGRHIDPLVGRAAGGLGRLKDWWMAPPKAQPYAAGPASSAGSASPPKAPPKPPRAPVRPRARP